MTRDTEETLQAIAALKAERDAAIAEAADLRRQLAECQVQVAALARHAAVARRIANFAGPPPPTGE